MTAKKKNKKNSKVVKKSNIKKDRSYIAFLSFALVLFVIILISTVYGDVIQIYNNKKEINNLTERHIELLEEEASLNSEVVKLQDPEYKARYAREKFLYTKDGEKILTIIDSDKNTKSVDEDNSKE